MSKYQNYSSYRTGKGVPVQKYIPFIATAKAEHHEKAGLKMAGLLFAVYITIGLVAQVLSWMFPAFERWLEK